MRRVLAALLVTAATLGSAAAADGDGTVKKFDPAKMTIVLEDGKTYKLPPEMDVSDLQEGKEVIFSYEAKNGVNQITDMLIQ